MACSQAALLRARRRAGVAAELEARRRWHPALVAEHLALAVALLAGLALMESRGWSAGHPRWLGVKLGLVAFVLVPLEAMHAWVGHVWIRRSLARGNARELERALGMDAMLRTLGAVLLLPALLLMAWLSLAQPF